MVDESGGICLNIAKLPVSKKKGKRKNEVEITPKPNKTIISKPEKTLGNITPKLFQKKETNITKTETPVSGSILKTPKTVTSHSIWKKFKQSYKKGDDAKSGAVKTPTERFPKKKVQLSETPDIINPTFSKTVSFGKDKTKSNDLITEGKSVKTTFVRKHNQLKQSPDNNTDDFSFMGLDNSTGETDVVSKKFKFSDNSDQSPEYNTGKKTSLFRNNPEIPDVPHRAVKPVKEPVFSNLSFEDINLHPYMVKYLKESMGLTKMTTVQEKSIPILLKNQDALIRSQTGSGKTLAYALPIIEKLQEIRPKISRSDGVLALVIVPTRELALQTYEVFNKLVKSYTWLVPGYLAGGEKKKSEKARLRKGITILIGTPGRLIDHVKTTRALSLDKVSWLVIDEADRLLDMGYEKDVSFLLEKLNQNNQSLLNPSYINPEMEKKTRNRQTVLLSATLTEKVEELAGLSLTDPVFVDACDRKESATTSNVPIFSTDIGKETDTMVLPEGLVQKYVITPTKLKLVTFIAFILWKSKLMSEKKMLVFIETQDMVDYYEKLLSSVLTPSGRDETTDDEDLWNYSNSGIVLFKLHGKMKQNERTEVFKTFRKSHSGILLCTDVASRGLDLPEVDWVIQYTGPKSVSDYVHRVGRTARGGQSGSSIIFLTTTEVKFIGKLENCQIRLQEERMESCLSALARVNPRGRTAEEEASNLQSMMENMVAGNGKLYDLACQAFASWSRYYASFPRNMRDVFYVKLIHQGHSAKTFALRDTPSAIVHHARNKNLNGKRERPRVRNDEEKSNVRSMRKVGRSRLSEISEYDSGLEPLNKRKR